MTFPHQWHQLALRMDLNNVAHGMGWITFPETRCCPDECVSRSTPFLFGPKESRGGTMSIHVDVRGVCFLFFLVNDASQWQRQ